MRNEMNKFDFNFLDYLFIQTIMSRIYLRTNHQNDDSIYLEWDHNGVIIDIYVDHDSSFNKAYEENRLKEHLHQILHVDNDMIEFYCNSDGSTVDYKEFVAVYKDNNKLMINTNELVDEIVESYPNYFDYTYNMTKTGQTQKLGVCMANNEFILCYPALKIDIHYLNHVTISKEEYDDFLGTVHKGFTRLLPIILDADSPYHSNQYCLDYQSNIAADYQYVESCEFDLLKEEEFTNFIDHLLVLADIQKEDNVSKITPEVYMKYLQRIDTSRVKRVN